MIQIKIKMKKERKITYDEDKNNYGREDETDDNEKYRITYDIEELKLGDTSYHSEIEDINKRHDKIDRIHDDDNENSD